MGRTILGVGGLLIQGLHDVDHDVDADGVGQLQRAHGQVVAQLARLVDVLIGTDVLAGQDGGLVHHRAHDAVGDEHGHVADGDELLAQAAGQGLAALDGVGGGVIGVDDLDELHGGHRAEEVHAEELLGALGGGGQLGDAQRGGVGDEDGLGLDQVGQLLEGLLLQLHVLDHGLDDDVDVGQVVQVGGGLQVGEPRVGLLLGDLALGDLLVEVVLDAGHALLQGGGAVVVQDDLVAAFHRDLGQTSAHRTCAVDANSLDFHDFCNSLPITLIVCVLLFHTYDIFTYLTAPARPGGFYP